VSRRPDAPSLGVVLVGGVGVLVVIAFVGAVALGGTSKQTPGEQVAVVRSDGPGGIAVLAGRCLDERVKAVEVDDADGTRLWRVESVKGSIERRYVVGAEPPLGFDAVTTLAARPAGRVRASIELEEGDTVTVDSRMVDMAGLPAEGELLDGGAPACAGREGPGGTAVLFAIGAAFVLAAYVGMLLRFRR
jgi:hypothetical protein